MKQELFGDYTFDIADAAAKEIASEYDIENPDSVVFAGFTYRRTPDNDMQWEVDIDWFAQCAKCLEVGIQQTRFTETLCEAHYNEAIEEGEADNYNDDVAIGLI